MSDRPDARESWKRLGVLATETVRTHLRDLGNDPARFASMSLRVGPLLIDFSRQRANADVVSALVALAQESRLEAAVEGLFDGGGQTAPKAARRSIRPSAPPWTNDRNASPPRLKRRADACWTSRNACDAGGGWA